MSNVRIRRAEKLAFARELRQRMTPQEDALWQALRNRKLRWKFRRQVPIGPFITDFCCKEYRLIVEVDGSVHDGEERNLYDRERTAYLESQGYVVMRVSNNAVDHDLPSVLDFIVDSIEKTRIRRP